MFLEDTFLREKECLALKSKLIYLYQKSVLYLLCANLLGPASGSMWPTDSGIQEESSCGVSLEIFQNCLDVVLGTLLWVSLLDQELGQKDPEVPSLNQPVIL